MNKNMKPVSGIKSAVTLFICLMIFLSSCVVVAGHPHPRHRRHVVIIERN